LLEVTQVDFVANMRTSQTSSESPGIFSSDATAGIKVTDCHFVGTSYDTLRAFDPGKSNNKVPNYYIVTGCTFAGSIQHESWKADNTENVEVTGYQATPDPKCARFTRPFSPSDVFRPTASFRPQPSPTVSPVPTASPVPTETPNFKPSSTLPATVSLPNSLTIAASPPNFPTNDLDRSPALNPSHPVTAWAEIERRSAYSPSQYLEISGEIPQSYPFDASPRTNPSSSIVGSAVIKGTNTQSMSEQFAVFAFRENPALTVGRSASGPEQSRPPILGRDEKGISG
jgi:hypothetical protein